MLMMVLEDLVDVVCLQGRVDVLVSLTCTIER